MFSWKILDIRIKEENTKDDINRLINKIRPDWKNATIEYPSGGLVNQMVICHNGDDSTNVTSDDAVVIRIRLHEKEEICFNHENEIPVIVKASEAGLCGKVLATFENGCVLEYIPGRVLKWADLQRPEILRLCAETLADFHSLKWREGDLPNATTKPELEHLSKRPILFPRIREGIACIPEHSKSSYADLTTEPWTKSELSSEVDFISGFVDKLNLPGVFSHNDFHFNNIIYNETEDKAYLIDYECTGFNYAAVDIASLFIESGWKHVGFIKESEPAPSNNQIQQFLHFYTRRRFNLEPDEPEFENVVTKYFIQVKAFQILYCLYWSSVMMMLGLSGDYPANDYARYGL